MLVLDGVSKSYRTGNGRVQVLDGISLTVRRGEHCGILGRNGAGKSTLVRLLSGMEKPTRGHIRRGMSVSWPLAFTGTFQGSLTGLDNLRFIARIYGRNAADMLPFVDDFSELGRYLREPVKTYSSGMTARLAFALSLAVNFDCFLIDEVIAVGDDRFREKCHEELFVRRREHAFVIVSHDAAMVRSYCNCAMVLEAGQLRSFESLDDAYSHYAQRNAA